MGKRTERYDRMKAEYMELLQSIPVGDTIQVNICTTPSMPYLRTLIQEQNKLAGRKVYNYRTPKGTGIMLVTRCSDELPAWTDFMKSVREQVRALPIGGSLTLDVDRMTHDGTPLAANMVANYMRNSITALRDKDLHISVSYSMERKTVTITRNGTAGQRGGEKVYRVVDGLMVR